MLFLDLNLAHIARVLNDLRDVRLVSSSDFARNTLSQIRKSAIHPVLPEDANAITERCEVGLDHAESAVDRPEDEEDNEQVVGVPEAFEVCSSRLLCCRECYGHQGKQHDISTPARACCEVGKDEAHESQVVAGRESCEIVPVRDSVHP